MATTLPLIERFIDQELRIREVQDEPNALNGLQLDATGGKTPGTIRSIALAVDATEAVIDLAIGLKADLLLVHHGLFWGGHRRLCGPYGGKIRKCFQNGLSVYAAHLPLDIHPSLGNNIGIARALGLTVVRSFGSHRGIDLGLELACEMDLSAFMRLCTSAVGPVRLFGKGPSLVRRIGVVSGGGGSCLREAAAKGLDVLFTGESAHYTALDAEEAGIHLILGGHYRTETFGVRALGMCLAEEFSLSSTFIDHDTGL